RERQGKLNTQHSTLQVSTSSRCAEHTCLSMVDPTYIHNSGENVREFDESGNTGAFLLKRHVFNLK
ncbi:MAG: hypothetical protein AAF360_17015, partial [Pseudomonadota bacterium]